MAPLAIDLQGSLVNHRGRLCHAGMEPLWSPVVATGGTQWQIRSARNPPKQAESVAVGCERLPEKFHGKEGVSGSSPEEGSAKSPHKRLFVSDQLAGSRTWGRYGALYGASRSKTPSSQAASLTEKRVPGPFERPPGSWREPAPRARYWNLVPGTSGALIRSGQA